MCGWTRLITAGEDEGGEDHNFDHQYTARLLLPCRMTCLSVVHFTLLIRSSRRRSCFKTIQFSRSSHLVTVVPRESVSRHFPQLCDWYQANVRHPDHNDNIGVADRRNTHFKEPRILKTGASAVRQYDHDWSSWSDRIFSKAPWSQHRPFPTLIL